MFTNRMPRFEPLSEDALATIDRGVDRLAAEVGVQFDHPGGDRALPRRGADRRRPDGALRPGLPARAGRTRAVGVHAARPGARALARGRRRRDAVRRGQRAAVPAARRRPPRRHDGRRRGPAAARADDRRDRHARAQHARAGRRAARYPPPRARPRRDPHDRSRLGRRGVVGRRGRGLPAHGRDRLRRPGGDRRRAGHLRRTATSTRRCSSTRACSRGSSPTRRRARP